MGMLEYYMVVNLYFLFFWIFYNFILKNELAFQQLRIYLISTIFISIILPFIHISSHSFSILNSHIPLKVSFTEISNIPFESIISSEGRKTSMEFELILKCLILSGVLLSLILNLYKHFKIYSLVKNAESIRYKSLFVKITTKPVIPFLYNKSIIIPKTISNEELNIVVEHEYQHYKFGHYIDNFLLQLFQIIFWINPFIYLLIRELRQVHEYQVDREIINSGIDASIYKLTLIKFSVGFQKFAIANGLSNYKIKKRIIMMSNENLKKWKWKFLLFIPAFLVVFLILSFTTFDNDSSWNNYEQQSLSFEQTSISYEQLQADNSNYVILMMNRKSQILINGKEKCTLDEVNEKVSISFQQKVADVHKQLNGNLDANSTPKIYLVIQKSIQTNRNDYDKLLENLAMSIFSLQEKYSNKLFGKSYNLLNASDKITFGGYSLKPGSGQNKS
jgi:beta-lactamase regulating signal transducer with metallopeptidase domain